MKEKNCHLNSLNINLTNKHFKRCHTLGFSPMSWMRLQTYTFIVHHILITPRPETTIYGSHKRLSHCPRAQSNTTDE